MDKIYAEINRLVINTEYDEISTKWLQRENVADMTNNILGMVLDVVGAITGRGGSRSEVYLHK